MKAADGELSGRQEVEEVVPQATQEANALRDRRQATTDATTTSTDDGDGAPAKSAKKDEWEAYAASLDIDTAGMTKDQIIEAVEAAE